MPETVNHINVGQRYRVIFERSAVKGVDGFKVEANGDEIDQVEKDAQSLYNYVKKSTFNPSPGGM